MKITERGWAGHFICADRCRFRRNTLIEHGGMSVVVSTVGLMAKRDDEGFDSVGAGPRWYETMAFQGVKEGAYVEANVGKEVEFSSQWSICADSWEELPEDSDNLADDMHEKVVVEIADRMMDGEFDATD